MDKIRFGRVATDRWILPLLLFLFATGCTPRVDIIPRETLFRSPERGGLRISPDGNTLAWIADVQGVPNLVTAQVGDTTRTILTRHEKPVSGVFYWVNDGSHLLYYTGDVKSSTTRLHCIELATGSDIPLLDSPIENSDYAQVRLYEISRSRPEMIAVGLNWRDPAIFDLYHVNVLTGEKKLVEAGPENLLWWHVDKDLAAWGYTVSEPDGGQSFWMRSHDTGRYRQEIVWTIEDDSGEPILLTPDRTGIYIYDSRGYNSTGIALYDISTRETTRLLGDDRYDVMGVMINPVTGEMEAGRILGAKMQWEAISEHVREDLGLLSEARPGNLNILSRSRNDSTWVVSYHYDTHPVEFYLYHRQSGDLTFLFNHRDDLAGLPLAPMEMIEYTARDGLKIEGYLTRPIGASRPGPLVVLVHGGPWNRDFWGFHPEAQWLANRGYTCLQINFRGSKGYGKEFLNAGNREWGRKMQDDLTDGVRYAIEKGWANEDRVGICGGSFGGYAALAGITFTPELYACAISVVGTPDILDYLGSIPPSWKAYQSNLDSRVGYLPRYRSGSRAGQVKDSSDWTEKDREEVSFLKSISPIYHTDAITTPLLMVQGGRDYLVHTEVADKFVAQLKANGLPVEYVVYENAGHGLSQIQDRLDFYRRAETFLTTYLGGRFEP